MRPIDADAVILNYRGLVHISPYDFQGIAKYFAEQIAAAPTIDAVPVVRGKWVMSDRQEGWVTCSVCKKMKFDGRMAFSPTLFVEWGLNFCPNCGADMREEDEAALGGGEDD